MVTGVPTAQACLGKADRVTVLTGAGISTAAGIPDFRGPQGLWTKDPLAERVSTLSCYLDDPQVRQLAWQRRAEQAAVHPEPTPAHLALVELERQGRLRGLITQNTDGLHLDAGHDPTLVHEIHGSARQVRCEECGALTPLTEQVARVNAGDPDPHCTALVGPAGAEQACGGILRATVILFEEMLNADVLRASLAAVDDAQVLLALGSTLSVNPVAALVPRAVGHGAKLIIVNDQPTEYDELANLVLRGDLQQIVPELIGHPAAVQV